ncbi:MAG: mechanosensitive ion channel family protein [Brevinematia bacterium]
MPRLFARGEETTHRIVSSIVAWCFVLVYFVYVNFLTVLILEPSQKTAEVISKVFISLYVLVGAVIMTKFVSSLILPYISERIRKMSGHGEVSFSVSIFSNTIGVILVTIGVGIILAVWNISLLPLLTTLGIGGLAIAIALQDTLANFFAGVQVLLVHQIRVGDYIKLENGEEGVVVDINWRNTTIRDLFNNLVIVPNSKLISGITKNYHLPDQEMSVVVAVEVSIENDLKFVEEITLDVAKEVQSSVEGAVKTWEPLIRYQSFTDYSIKFNVILRVVEYTYQFPVRHEFLKRLHSRFKQENVKLSIPLVNIKNMG